MAAPARPEQVVKFDSGADEDGIDINKFKRYDFTPEILRVPYTQPKPMRAGSDEGAKEMVEEYLMSSPRHRTDTPSGVRELNESI